METKGSGRIYWMGCSQYQTQLNEGTIKPGYRLTTTNLGVPETFIIQPDGELEPVNKQERARKRSTAEVLSRQYWYAKKGV